MLARALDASISPFLTPVSEHEATIASLEADVASLKRKAG